MSMLSTRRDADIVALFCRLNFNRRRNLPLRSSEMGLLIFIAQSQTPPSPLDAARFFRVSKPMIASMVKSLVSKGYLIRESSPLDKRSAVLIATPLAHDLVQRTQADYLCDLEKLAQGLGQADYDTLVALLARANSILMEVE